MRGDFKELKRVLQKEKGYGKATAEAFASLNIRRLYQIVERHDELFLKFTRINILENNPQRKERCLSCLEDLHSSNIEMNVNLIELINKTQSET